MDDARKAILELEIDLGRPEQARRGRGRPRSAAPPRTHCKKGHELTPDNVTKGSDRRCLVCSREQAKAWQKANPERFKELQRDSNLRRRWRDPSEARTRQLARYGLTPATFLAMLEAQGFLCLICGVTLTTERQLDAELRRVQKRNGAVVDHCHTTGRVRGILCMLCNRGLGDFEDDAARLLKAAAYLANTGGA